jgi:hypothetical protein
MRHLFKVLLVLFCCSLSHYAIAQKTKLYLETNKTYPKGNIYIKKSLIPIPATGLTLVHDSILQYTDTKTGLAKSLNLTTSSINYVKMKTGTKAGEFALYGGGLMCLSAIYGVLSAEKTSVDVYGETSGIKWFPFVAGFTAGGAIIGGLIGVFCPKYKNFYIKDNLTTYSFKISPVYYKSVGPCLGMQVTF